MNAENASVPSPVNYRRIAEACGVGKTTVGRVLQGTGYVAEKTREKVLQAAKKLGYRPDPALGALTRRRWPLGAKPQTATLAWIHQPLLPPSHQLAPEFVGARQ
ncbi:MAG: LacI family transcriptional regulator, partial [Cupriavidus sp.]